MIVKIEAVLEKDQEYKRDMRIQMSKQLEQNDQIIKAVTQMEGMRRELDVLWKAKDSCAEDGCPKAQDAYEIASRAWGFIYKGLIGIGTVVGLAILGKVLS